MRPSRTGLLFWSKPPAAGRRESGMRSSSYCLSGDRIDRVETTCKVRTCVVVTLPRVVEGALRIQKFHQRGLAAPVAVLHGGSHIARLVEQVALDAGKQFARSIVGDPGVANFVLHARL